MNPTTQATVQCTVAQLTAQTQKDWFTAHPNLISINTLNNLNTVITEAKHYQHKLQQDAGNTKALTTEATLSLTRYQQDGNQHAVEFLTELLTNLSTPVTSY